MQQPKVKISLDLAAPLPASKAKSPAKISRTSSVSAAIASLVKGPSKPPKSPGQPGSLSRTGSVSAAIASMAKRPFRVPVSFEEEAPIRTKSGRPLMAKRRSSVVESLAAKVREQVVGKRDTWKEQHVGASTNLKAARANAKHSELNRSMRHLMKVQQSRVEYPSSFFFDTSAAFESFAVSLESSTREIGDNLEAKIGAGLIASGIQGSAGSKLLARDEAFRAWDQNGDGKISKMEWRVQIRKLPGCQHDDVHKIDELFAKFDSNDNDFIEPKELEPALAVWRDASKDADTRLEDIRRRVTELRAVAKELRRVARITAELEAEDAKLAQMKGVEPTLTSRIGKVLTLRNMRAADIAQQAKQGGWDTDGDGRVDKLEFRFHIRKLGSGLQAAADEELDDLFKSLDGDGSGTLEMKELQESLRGFQTAAAMHVADLEEQVVVVKAMVKPVKEAQTKAIEVIDNAEALPDEPDESDESDAEIAA